MSNLVWTDQQFLKSVLIIPDLTPDEDKPLPMELPLEFDDDDGLGAMRGLINALGIMAVAAAVTVALYLL